MRKRRKQGSLHLGKAVGAAPAVVLTRGARVKVDDEDSIEVGSQKGSGRYEFGRRRSADFSVHLGELRGASNEMLALGSQRRLYCRRFPAGGGGVFSLARPDRRNHQEGKHQRSE